MKKMSTLFKVVHEKGKPSITLNEVRPENQWVFTEEGVRPTRKHDGTAIAFINGSPFKRYDAKHGKIPPAEAIPCCEPDSVTGHWPHWLPIDESDNNNRWFFEALNTFNGLPEDGTYELIGPSINGNREKLSNHILVKHGDDSLDLHNYSFESIRQFLNEHDIEGIVFHGSDSKMCKIRKKDFGIKR